ncbi:nucleic acid/nucleotide deaminase domain-containing protein [Streptomyces sp. NPDC093252]|uniref:nucleic acid/nucleotide deaminase domain-containing protein n=1 Tax=Streptomyces sp. NPDC093252 TaxID=3154980 RepID=UPI0034498108
MSEPAPDSATAHFGDAGMRRFVMADAERRSLLPEVVRQVEEIGVPLQVARYFTAAEPYDGLRLGLFAGHQRIAVPQEETAGWLRVGFDGPLQMCVRPDGALQGVFLGIGEPAVFVSSSVNAFNQSLTALDRSLGVIAAAADLPSAAVAFRELNEELREIDPVAFAGRENWWPRVLDDVRHTLNFPFSASFEYRDGTGRKHIATESTGPGRAHPEELVWQKLSAGGVEPAQVLRVYCELQPCMMPGHYCAAWMQAAFPHAEFTHSFDYGTDADSREQGMKELITYAAQQAGRR